MTTDFGQRKAAFICEAAARLHASARAGSAGWYSPSETVKEAIALAEELERRVPGCFADPLPRIASAPRPLPPGESTFVVTGPPWSNDRCAGCGNLASACSCRMGHVDNPGTIR